MRAAYVKSWNELGLSLAVVLAAQTAIIPFPLSRISSTVLGKKSKRPEMLTSEHAEF